MIYLKAIVFIGTNKSGSSREATRAAERLGYFTILFTNNEKQLQQRRSYPDIHRMILIDTLNIERMKEEIDKLGKTGLEIKVSLVLLIHLFILLPCYVMNFVITTHPLPQLKSWRIKKRLEII